jgi:hypothetical protein
MVFDVATAVGDITVTADEQTSIVDDTSAVTVEAVRPGLRLLVAGLVTANRRIEAQTLALGEEGDPPVTTPVRILRNANPDLAGPIVAVGLPENGEYATVVIEDDQDRRYVLKVDAESAARLVLLQRVLGTRVRVNAIAVAGGRYSLEFVEGEPAEPSPPAETSATPGPGRPDDVERPGVALVSIEGVVLGGRDGEIVVLTRRGRVGVDLNRTVRVLPGASGLDRGQILSGEGLAGYGIVVRGGLDPETSVVVANVVLVGRRFEGR